MAGNDELAAVKNDASMVSNMVLGSVFNADGINQLLGVAQGAGQNMPAAIAHALFMNISGAKQALMRNQLPVDGRVWTAKGGVVDKVILETADILASNLGEQFASPQFKGAVRQELLGIMQQDEAQAQAPPEVMGAASMQEPMPPQGMPMEQPPMAPEGLVAPMQQSMEGMHL